MAEIVDIESPPALLTYLRTTARISPTESPTITTLAGGVSNKTVLVTRPTGEAWVLKQALPKLRVAVEWLADPARIQREALGIRHLSTLCPPGTITPLIFEDPANFLLAMQAVPQPHDNWKSLLLAGDVRTDHVDQFAALLGAIHRRAAESTEPLREIFADRSYFESLRLEPYYAYTASQVPAAAGFLHDLIASTRQRTLTLVHGDYSPKNVLIHKGCLILLDHEVIHWGDPAFDLGFALAHLLGKALHLRSQRLKLFKASLLFVETYRSVVGAVHWTDQTQTMVVRHALGCLLARVAGRSPLEYLAPVDRVWLRETVVKIIAHLHGQPGLMTTRHTLLPYFTHVFPMPA